MKRFLIPILILSAFLCTLAGCGECRHEWSAADCLNPAVCSKCDAVGEGALGHDWVGASCVSPEVCGRCGESRGDPLGHTYGNWDMGDTQMVRSCELCGSTESAPPDREVYLHQLLTGRWEYYGTNMSGQWVNPYQAPWFTYAEYDGAGTLHYVTGQVSQDMQMVYTGYDASRNTYTGYAITGSDSHAPFELEVREQGNLLVTNAGGEMEVVYCQYATDTSVLPGSWATTANGKLYSITLNEDRTFTGNIGEEISGYWLMLPDSSDGGHAEGGCMLYYEQNGKWINAVGDVRFFAASPNTAPEYSLFLFPKDGEELVLKQTDDATLEAMRSELAEAREKILGEWTSLGIDEWDGSRRTPRITQGYHLTVYEDGTFTLSIGKEIHGSWQFDSVTHYDEYTAYSYLTDYASSQGNEGISFNTQSNRLTFFYRDDRHGYVHYITFAHLTEQEMAEFLLGPELLPGEYVSEKILFFDNEAQEYWEIPKSDYRISIFPDGTYTVTLDETVIGEWFFHDLHPEGGHRYLFNHKGSQYLSQRLENGTLAFDCRIDGYNLIIHFQKTNSQ